MEEYRPYETVLRRCLSTMMRKYGLDYTEADGDTMMADLVTWSPFPDVPPVLRILRQYTKIVIISNTEDRLIEKNIENIGVPFDDYITAEQARAYKPAKAVFDYTLRKLNCEKATSCTWPTATNTILCPPTTWAGKAVWINRDDDQGDQEKYGPYEELPDLTGLPALIGI